MPWPCNLGSTFTLPLLLHLRASTLPMTPRDGSPCAFPVREPFTGRCLSLSFTTLVACGSGVHSPLGLVSFLSSPPLGWAFPMVCFVCFPVASRLSSVMVLGRHRLISTLPVDFLVRALLAPLVFFGASLFFAPCGSLPGLVRTRPLLDFSPSGFVPRVCSPRVELPCFLLPTSRASPHRALLDFDSSLGFPGEGWLFLFRVLRVLSVVAMAAPAPLTPADTERATRRSGLLLQADRVVRPVTRSNRAKLAAAFSEWLLQHQGRDLHTLIEVPLDSIEQISEALVAYGQYLFRSGQAYYKYSETINAVASLRPSIRRTLSRPWDLAFAWLTEEPSIHHKAMPKSILLAVMSVALLWGWATEAAIFGMTWAGLLRIGETLNALRSDLILPDDAAPGTSYALLQIRAPKTRGRSARHQAARIDPCDIVKLLAAVFGPLPQGAKLWPFSDGVLRRRLRTILHRLCLLDDAGPAFDLASLRPGGATWLLSETENAELVRRRGRWLSGRVMEIYLQEVTAITYVPRLPAEARAAVESLAASFAWILEKALFFEESSIPRRAWYYLFADRPTALARKDCC